MSQPPMNLLAALKEADGRVFELERVNRDLRFHRGFLAYLLACAVFALALVMRH